MKTNVTRRSVMALGIAALSLAGIPAMADDDYPSKPVTLVVAYAAGGGTDAIARLFAAQFEKELGGRVIVDNRPGAAGNMGTDVAAKADPDGYTLLIGNQGPMVVNPHIFEMRHDPAEALDPIAMIADASLVVVVGPPPAGHNFAGTRRKGQGCRGWSTARPATSPPATSRRCCSARPPASISSTFPTRAQARQ